MSGPHPLMTAAEVCQTLRISPMTVTRYRKAGKIACVTMPGSRVYRYFRAEIAAIIAGQPLTRAQVRELRDAYMGGAL